VAQQAVTLQSLQRHLAQAALYPLKLGAFFRGDLLQSQHPVQAQAADQLGDHLFGAPRQHQQLGAALAQGAVQRGETFQEEACAVHAEAAHAEFARLQLRRVEDEKRQQAFCTQGGLQGRVVVESQILFEPEQGVHGGVLGSRQSQKETTAGAPLLCPTAAALSAPD
jgi:hypothetical protein